MDSTAELTLVVEVLISLPGAGESTRELAMRCGMDVGVMPFPISHTSPLTTCRSQESWLAPH